MTLGLIDLSLVPTTMPMGVRAGTHAPC